MLTNGEDGDRETRTRYLVDCDGCSFERTTDGREEATRVGADHRRSTDHAIIAVEVPPSMDTK